MIDHDITLFSLPIPMILLWIGSLLLATGAGITLIHFGIRLLAQTRSHIAMKPKPYGLLLIAVGLLLLGTGWVLLAPFD